MKIHNTVLSVLLVVIVVFAYVSIYTVNEGEQALLLRLGKIVTNSQGKPRTFGPGLHWKTPFITDVKIFDMRLQTLDIKSSRIVTAEQKDVIVDYFVKWRISDPGLYYTRTGGNAEQANVLLEQQLNDGLRAEFGKRSISEVVSDDRTTIMDALSQQANLNAQRLGIQVIDVRIKRIDLPTEVSTAVFERMRAERERVAMEHRSTGKANAEAIRANADANVTIAVATAKEKAAELRSQGDAQAAQIYANAYSQDSGFYAFYRSLLAYKKVFSNQQNNILVLRPDSQFFKYFNGNESSGKRLKG